MKPKLTQFVFVEKWKYRVRYTHTAHSGKPYDDVTSSGSFLGKLEITKS